MMSEDSSRPALSNTLGTSHMWLFNLIKTKSKIHSSGTLATFQVLSSSSG